MQIYINVNLKKEDTAIVSSINEIKFKHKNDFFFVLLFKCVYITLKYK